MKISASSLTILPPPPSKGYVGLCCASQFVNEEARALRINGRQGWSRANAAKDVVSHAMDAAIPAFGHRHLSFRTKPLVYLSVCVAYVT